MARRFSSCCRPEWTRLPQAPFSRAHFAILRSGSRRTAGEEIRAAVAALCLVALLVFFHTIDKLAPLDQLLAFPAFVALGAVVVASGASGCAWLSGRTFRFIGKISYGMYVWHLVVMRLILTKVSVPETTSSRAWWLFYAVMIVGTVCGTIVVALISWHVIERPFLRLKRFVPST